MVGQAEQAGQAGQAGQTEEQAGPVESFARIAVQQGGPVISTGAAHTPVSPLLA